MDIHTAPISCIHLSPSENLVLTSSENILKIFFFKNDTFNLKDEIKNETKILSAKFLDDQKIIFSDNNGNLIIFDILKNKKENLKICDGPIFTLTSQKFEIFCGCFDGKIRIYNLNTKKIIEINDSIFGISSLSSIQKNNSIYLISGGMDSKIRIYENNQFKKIFSDHSFSINDLIFCKNKNLFLFASISKNKIVIYKSNDKNNLLNFDVQIIDTLDEPLNIAFNDYSICLTVSFGKKRYLSYLPNPDGIFEEVECLEENE